MSKKITNTKISKYFTSTSDNNSPYKQFTDESITPVLNNSADDVNDFQINSNLIKKPLKVLNSKLSVHKPRKKKLNVKSTSEKIDKLFRKLEDINPDHLQISFARSKSESDCENLKVNAFEQLICKNIPTKKINKNSKFRFINPVLNTRKQEDREKLLASRISALLGLNQTSKNCNNDSFDNPQLFSEILREYHKPKRYFDTTGLNSEYYNKTIKEPTISKCGCLLRDWAKIPGRDQTEDFIFKPKSISGHITPPLFCSEDEDNDFLPTTPRNECQSPDLLDYSPSKNMSRLLKSRETTTKFPHSKSFESPFNQTHKPSFSRRYSLSPTNFEEGFGLLEDFSSNIESNYGSETNLSYNPEFVCISSDDDSNNIEQNSQEDNIQENIRITPPSPEPCVNISNPIFTTQNAISDEIIKTPLPLKDDRLTIKTQNVTPMDNFDAMDTPKVLNELNRYGLKGMKRQRGIKLLKYIYESTHPLVEFEDGTNSKLMKMEEMSDVSEGKINARRSLILDEDPIKIVGDLKEDGGFILEKKRSKKLHYCPIALHIVWSNLVSVNRQLREKIVLYEAIPIEYIRDLITEQGFKFELNELLRFLDTKCIPIKSAQNNNKNRKKLVK